MALTQHVSYEGYIEYKLSDSRGGRSQGPMQKIACEAIFSVQGDTVKVTLRAGSRSKTTTAKWTRKTLPSKTAAKDYVRSFAPDLLPPATKFHKVTIQ